MRISTYLSLLTLTLPLTTALPTPHTALSTHLAYDGDRTLERLVRKAGSKWKLRLLARDYQGETMACAFAELFFGEDNLLGTDPTYEEWRTRHWSQAASLSPSCIISPSSPRQVQIAYGIARLSGTQFAVRSGGHNTSPGFANIDNGLLISLEQLNEVSYYKDANAVVVGVGNRWGRVYSELDQFNVTVVGGRVPDVGVGGLLLGGGLSYLSNRYGLASDNVLNYEIVIANGTLINANRHENADLWWALKGGANNFGIVTRYTLRAIPISTIWAGVYYYHGSQNQRVLQAYATFQHCSQSDPSTGLLVQITSDATVGTFVNVFYDRPVLNPAAFAMFREIPHVADTTQIWRYSEFLASQAQSYFIPRWQLRGSSYKADEASDLKSYEIARREFEGINELGGAYILIYQPVSESLIDVGLNRTTPITLTRTPQTWFSTAVGWGLPSNDAAIYAMSKSVQDKLEEYTKKRGTFLDYIFMNDAFRDQPVIERYGREVVGRLQRVLRKWDPKLVLRRLMPGGFKIPLGGVCSNCE